MQLSEQYRPRQWSEVVGQEKVLAKLNNLRSRGLNGRAYFLSGASGTGKSSIADLIAAETADDWAITEFDGGQVTETVLDAIERDCRQRPFGKGVCYIINECHGMRSPVIRRLLVLLDPRTMPSWITVVFTTTVEGQDKLFEDCDDTHPLMSRCSVLNLARRDLAKPFAERARAIAVEAGLDGADIKRYISLVRKHQNNLRSVLGAIECGEMMQGETDADEIEKS